MHTSFVLFLMAGVVVTAIIASIYDYREQRIPNLLLLAAMIYGIVVFMVGFHLANWQNVGRGLIFPIIGIVICGLVMLMPYKFRQVAAGDVKLAMVFGFMLGPIGGVLAILNGAIFGGLWALYISWQQGGLGKLWSNLKLMFHSAWTSGFKELGWDLDSDGALTMPYGVALSFGALTIVGWQLWVQFAPD